MAGKLYKYYVDVVTLIYKDGNLTPLFVEWGNKKYKVDKVLSIRETFSQAGGCGICYECRFGSCIRRLFWEKDKWFLESSVFIPQYED